jgi:hypothetical protein
LRRGRVIVGGPGHGYKPEQIFGQGNTFRSQRLFGELHMNDWPVTQAKDAFDWADGLEEFFVNKLASLCKDYGDKCESIRREPQPVTRKDMENATRPTLKVFSDPEFARWITQQMTNSEGAATTEEGTEEKGGDVSSRAREPDGPIVYSLHHNSVKWTFKMYWFHNDAEAQWMSLRYKGGETDEILIEVNTAHPFIAGYISDKGVLQVLTRLIIALALTEKIVRSDVGDRGMVDPASFRSIMNRVLKRVCELEEV